MPTPFLIAIGALAVAAALLVHHRGRREVRRLSRATAPAHPVAGPVTARTVSKEGRDETTASPSGFSALTRRGPGLKLGLVDLSHAETVPREVSLVRLAEDRLELALEPTAERNAFQRRVLVVDAAASGERVVTIEARVQTRESRRGRIVLTLTEAAALFPTRLGKDSEVTLSGGVALVTNRKKPHGGELRSLGLTGARIQPEEILRDHPRTFAVIHPTGSPRALTVEAVLARGRSPGAHDLRWDPDTLPRESLFEIARHLHARLRRFRPVARPSNRGTGRLSAPAHQASAVAPREEGLQ